MKVFKLDPIPGTEGKGSHRPTLHGKSFGYQVLGFGSGGGAQPVEMDYLMMGGGGGGAPWPGGGAGAGGYRTSYPGGTKLGIEDGTAIVIGAGAPGLSGTTVRGVVSSIGTTESAGGGGGGGPATGDPGLGITPVWYQDGGCGGGGNQHQDSSTKSNAPDPYWGMGNFPPVSPSQGFTGASAGANPSSSGMWGGSGGGGAGAHGVRCPGPSPGGAGGAGAANSITGSPVTRGGGGGGGVYGVGAPGGAGGSGGGGAGAPRGAQGTAGSANQGGGGGGGSAPGANGGAGGSGVVYLRVPAATAPGTLSVTPGTNSVATLPPGDKVCTFTITGTIVF